MGCLGSDLLESLSGLHEFPGFVPSSDCYLRGESGAAQPEPPHEWRVPGTKPGQAKILPQLFSGTLSCAACLLGSWLNMDNPQKGSMFPPI